MPVCRRTAPGSDSSLLATNQMPETRSFGIVALQDWHEPAPRQHLPTIARFPSCSSGRGAGSGVVWIFTEFLDWDGGDDVQCRTVAPITSDESARLIADGKDVELEWVGSLGTGRRVLVYDHPTGEAGSL